MIGMNAARCLTNISDGVQVNLYFAFLLIISINMSSGVATVRVGIGPQDED